MGGEDFWLSALNRSGFISFFIALSSCSRCVADWASVGVRMSSPV